uniref:DSBA-like thioredoxin domain-containing protein n=1 Tax=Pseudictyota dubia TaxID=2749911 RepID=A0A7R9VFB1_9STRA|mmetsp:Transcript_13207/g.24606  ORF Transcript_13207/g.24606 Transcript_13207/m.24606 type:complete len:173 (+) Transcript_13207:236-754(+)
MIDPQTNPTGEEFEAYNIRRWGSSGWTRHLKSEGRKDGAKFEKWTWWPNTSKAHQLVLFAERSGIDTNASNRALFEAVYEEGMNISLVEVLVQIGSERLNLDATKLRQFLEGDEGKREVVRQIQTGRQKYRISGVPYFIVGRDGSDELPYGLSGAQTSRTFLQCFEELCEDM